MLTRYRAAGSKKTHATWRIDRLGHACPVHLEGGKAIRNSIAVGEVCYVGRIILTPFGRRSISSLPKYLSPMIYDPAVMVVLGSRRMGVIPNQVRCDRHSSSGNGNVVEHLVSFRVFCHWVRAFLLYICPASIFYLIQDREGCRSHRPGAFCTQVKDIASRIFMPYPSYMAPPNSYGSHVKGLCDISHILFVICDGPLLIKPWPDIMREESIQSQSGMCSYCAPCVSLCFNILYARSTHSANLWKEGHYLQLL